MTPIHPTLAACREEIAQHFAYFDTRIPNYGRADEILAIISARIGPVLAAAEADRWIPSAERMPPIDKLVILPGGFGCWRGGHWDSLVGQTRAIEWDVDHWRPLPAPPITTSQEKP